jgi:hypothetical protein
VFGINVQTNGNADYGINVIGTGCLVADCNVQGANVVNLYVNGPGGAARCTVWNIRSDNPSSNGATNIWIDGPDHNAVNLRTTGASTNGWAMKVSGSRLMWSDGHITSNGTAAGNFLLDGRQNRISDVYLDSGPNGTNGEAHTVIEGQGNYLSALIQNAACTAAETITNAVLQSGTTWRLTTGTTHGYAVGDPVWLQGFTPSTYNNNWLITAIPSTTTFEVNLGASTAMSVLGTSKRPTKYGLAFRKSSAGAYVQGNFVHAQFEGEGAGTNDAEFYYAVGFLDESGDAATGLARFAGNRVVGNAVHTTTATNIESSFADLSDADKVELDLWHLSNSTSAPMGWRTKNSGEVTVVVSGATYSIPHGLTGKPSRVQVTPRSDPGSRFWISSVTNTNIVVTVSTTPTAGTSKVWAFSAQL